MHFPSGESIRCQCMVLIEFSVLVTGTYFFILYCFYISVYDETNYVSSSCLITDMTATSDTTGTLTVKFGDDWGYSTKLTDEPHIGCWCLGDIEVCYHDINNNKNNIDTKSETEYWPVVSFFPPTMLYILYYCVIFGNLIFIIIPIIIHGSLLIWKKSRCCKRLRNRFGPNYNGYDTFVKKSYKREYYNRAKKEMFENLVIFLIVLGLFFGFIVLIVITVWGTALINYHIPSLPQVYNTASYENSNNTSWSNFTDDIYFDSSYEQSDHDNENEMINGDYDYYICNVTDIIELKFDEKVISWNDYSSLDANFNVNKKKKQFTYLWLLYEVMVFKLEDNASSTNDDSFKTIGFELSNDDWYLLNQTSFAMETFVVHSINNTMYNNYTVFDYKKIGDFDFCYKSKHLNNQFQFTKPKNNYIKKLNFDYGTLLIIVGLAVATFCVLVICCNRCIDFPCPVYCGCTVDCFDWFWCFSAPGCDVFHFA